MGWLIAIVALWLGYWVLRGLFALLGAITKELGKVSGEITKETGKLGERIKREIAATRFFNTPEAGAWFIALAILVSAVSLAWGATTVLSAFDNIAGGLSPYVGWLILGVPAGALLSFRSRIRTLSGFRQEEAIGRVPSIEALHSGERAANKIHSYRRWIAVGAGAVIIAVMAISSLTYVSASLGSEPMLGGSIQKSFFARFPALDEAIQNDSLQKAARVLFEDPPGVSTETLKSALTLLKRLSDSEKLRPTDTRIAARARTATSLLGRYRDDTAVWVRDRKTEALRRAIAYSLVDQAESEFWIGNLCERGVCPEQAGALSAFDHYRRAVEHGNERAKAALPRTAERLVKSQDAKDRASGYAYFRQELDSDRGDGYLWLGRQLLSGDGASVDKEAAGALFVKALQAEDVPSALAAFDELRSCGTPCGNVGRALDDAAPLLVALKNPAARAKGYEYLEQRASEGDPVAQLWTGYRYKNGATAPSDYSKAREWFVKASQQTSNMTVQKRALAALRVMNGPNN